MIAVVVMTDGRRQYMVPAMDSLRAQVDGPIGRRVIHDDSGDLDYRNWLAVSYPDWEIIGPTGGRSGFCGAYRSAWTWLDALDDTEWVFQTEDDFTFDTRIDLQVLIDVMTANRHLLQMQLRRQPWWTEPQGGFIGQWPDLYTDAGADSHAWLEHRRNWSTNPGLFRRDLCQWTWPPPPGCEKTLGDQLLHAYPQGHFAVWGGRDDPPVVRHIGHERIGHSY